MGTTILTTLILLSGSVLLVQAAGLLGTSECTYGPSYWCGSLRNAKQCSAVSHCIQTVWEKQHLPEDNDDICNICKNMVQEARDQLESNQTQEELKAVFDGACKLIPLHEISEECMELANEFIPELIETLASQMNPQIVCATAGLCNSVYIDRKLREQGLSHNQQGTPVTQISVVSSVSDPDPGDCDDCHKYIEDTIKLVREHSKQELLDHLLAICGELGSASDGCSALMSVNIDVIYNYLANQLNADDACSLFGMCNGLFGPVPRPASANTGDEACDFCIVIAQHWRDQLTSNTTEEQFQEVLEGICQQTGSFKDECLSLVENYSIAVYNYFMDKFDPKELCEVVGICSTNTDKAVWTTLHTGPLAGNAIVEEKGGDASSLDRVSLHFVGQDEANSYKGEAKHAPEVLPRANLLPSIKISVAGESGVLDGSSEACTMCEFTLHFIQIQLQDKHTKEDIENAVKKVCNYMPKDLSEQCDDYVDAYGDQVIALLQQEIDPSVVCPMLGLCPGNSNVSTNVANTIDVTCVACEFIMVKVKEILGDRTNQDAIREALDSVCGLLPQSLSNECETFVVENAIEVIQLLAGGVDPKQICHLLGMCWTNMGGLPPLDSTNQLPVSRLFVPRLRHPNINAYNLEHGGQSKVCVMCEFAMAMLEKLVLDNNTHIADKIEQAVEQVCILLPTTLQEDCLGFVEQYSEALIQLLINGLAPEMVCRELHLCKQPKLDGLPQATVHRRSVRNAGTGLLGSEKCTWGPSYWCESVQNAQACGATSHCVERVWMGAAPSSDGLPHATVQRRSVPDAADAAAVSDDRRCLICKAVVNAYKDSDGDAAAVDAVCSPLTGNEQQLCSTIPVSDVAANDQGKGSTAVCATLQYCPKPKNLPGSEKCSWGPTYWCESVLHAQACGVTRHCMEKYWMGAAPSI